MGRVLAAAAVVAAASMTAAAAAGSATGSGMHLSIRGQQVSVPWTRPLAFGHLRGWATGRGGTTRSLYEGRRSSSGLESAAWIARGVSYRDGATVDPPNGTLAHLPPAAVVVWAVIFSPVRSGQLPIRLVFDDAKRFACCDAVAVAGGERELTGAGPGGAYSVIVRVYFGSPLTAVMRAEAQRALDRLELPPR